MMKLSRVLWILQTGQMYVDVGADFGKNWNKNCLFWKARCVVN